MPGIALLSELSDYERVLQRGDQVPHFEVRTSGAELFRCASIWQRKNLLLVALPGDAPPDACDSLEQAARGDAFQPRESVYVEWTSCPPRPTCSTGSTTSIGDAPSARVRRSRLASPLDVVRWFRLDERVVIRVRIRRRRVARRERLGNRIVERGFSNLPFFFGRVLMSSRKSIHGPHLNPGWLVPAPEAG
jgi:hypothetical protein